MNASYVTPAALAIGLASAVACYGTGAGLDAQGRPISAGLDGDSSGGGDDESLGGLSQIQTQIFTPSCATADCHVSSVAPHGLVLTPDFSHRLLVGVQADEAPTMVRVVPGQPDDSYLMSKIVADDTRSRGKRMPRDGPPFLTDDEVEMIRTWIAAGAGDN